jgi:hypothetical protein
MCCCLKHPSLLHSSVLILAGYVIRLIHTLSRDESYAALLHEHKPCLQKVEDLLKKQAIEKPRDQKSHFLKEVGLCQLHLGDRESQAGVTGKATRLLCQFGSMLMLREKKCIGEVLRSAPDSNLFILCLGYFWQQLTWVSCCSPLCVWRVGHLHMCVYVSISWGMCVCVWGGGGCGCVYVCVCGHENWCVC